MINPNRQGFSAIEANNWYSYVSNNPMKYTDPTGLMGEEEYYENLQKNYMPTVGGVEIDDITPYIKLDENGKAITNDEGAAIFNEEGEKVLGKAGWSIESKDVFHEEDGKPVVKLTHEGGGEQIYDMESGDLVDNQEYGGTFNVVPPPYDIDLRSLGHVTKDINPWKKYGGGPNDPSTKAERLQRYKEGKKNNFGSSDRNLAPPPPFPH